MAARFFALNLIDQSGTTFNITTGTEDANFPLTNMKNPHSTKVFRTTSGTSAVIEVDLQAVSSADYFLLRGHDINGLLISAVTIEANATNSWGSPAFSTTVTDFDTEENLASVAFGSTQTYRYWRFTFTSSTAPVEVSNIFLGLKTELTNQGIALGWKFTRIDNTEIVVNRYGQKFIDTSTDIKKIEASMTVLNVTEMESMNDVFDYCGNSKPVWVIVDPSETIVNNKDRFAGMYYFKERPGFVNDSYSIYSAEFELEEAK